MASEPSERTPTRHPRRAFQDILDNIEAVRTYIEGMNRASFEADQRTVDAVERCLQRLTEAAFRLDATAEIVAPDIPWNEIRGLGNRLRHEYDGLSLDTIWQSVTDNLDPLKAACNRALAQLPPDPP